MTRCRNAHRSRAGSRSIGGRLRRRPLRSEPLPTGRRSASGCRRYRAPAPVRRALPNRRRKARRDPAAHGRSRAVARSASCQVRQRDLDDAARIAAHRLVRRIRGQPQSDCSGADSVEFRPQLRERRLPLRLRERSPRPVRLRPQSAFFRPVPFDLPFDGCSRSTCHMRRSANATFDPLASPTAARLRDLVVPVLPQPIVESPALLPGENGCFWNPPIRCSIAENLV